MDLKDLKRKASDALQAMLAEEAVTPHQKRNMREWWVWTGFAIPIVEQQIMNEELYRALMAMERFYHAYELYLTAKKQGRGAAISLLLRR